jgi:hypothetical protein
MDSDKFLATVNNALTISADAATQEMQDAATVAHKCIIKLNDLLESNLIPVGYDKDGAMIYSPHTPSVINSIAQANNTAMSSLRKIRRLDVQDDQNANNSGIDALLKQAHGKLTLTQTIQSIEIDTSVNNNLDDII